MDPETGCRLVNEMADRKIRADALLNAGHPLNGFYAAGEVAGGVHGACRLGSCAIIDCLVFGRIAGQEASKL